MIGLFCFALAVLASPFKSKLRLQAENAVLRHQLIVLRRSLHGRVRFTNHDRWFLIQLYRWFPSILQVLTVIQPRRSCVGTRRAFLATGVGTPAHWEGDRRSTRSCAMPRSRFANIMFGPTTIARRCTHERTMEVSNTKSISMGTSPKLRNSTRAAKSSRGCLACWPNTAQS